MLEGFNDVLVTLVGGGLISAIVSFLVSKRKDKRDDFAAIIDVLKEENKALREKEDRNAEQMRALEIALVKLQNKVTLLESAHQDFPFPMWLKDTDGTMLSVNKAYESIFLRPINKTAEDYVGKKDVDVWGEEIAARFRKNDKTALHHGGLWSGIEYINDPFNEGQKIELQTYKFKRQVGGATVGIGGVAFIKK